MNEHKSKKTFGKNINKLNEKQDNKIWKQIEFKVGNLVWSNI
jgi:hypothetical protein